MKTDQNAFFAASIGLTRSFAASAVVAQTPDDEGPLPPGRYLLQVTGFTDSTAICWVGVSPFEKGAAATLAATPGPDRIPLSSGAFAVEFNVRRGVSDRVQAILSAGTATIYITRVSYKL